VGPSIKPTSSMTPQLKSVLSPRTATTISQISSKTKYIQGGNKIERVHHSELVVSRMLDFSEAGNKCCAQI
jgi:hypothetical protein